MKIHPVGSYFNNFQQSLKKHLGEKEVQKHENRKCIYLVNISFRPRIYTVSILKCTQDNVQGNKYRKTVQWIKNSFMTLHHLILNKKKITKHHHQEIPLKIFIFILMCFVKCITVKLLLPFAIVVIFVFNIQCWNVTDLS